MVNYIYKGYGVTDSNGVAHLDHDASGNPINHSYTGVGAGEIDVVASLDNPVSSGSIVSETYSVLDTLYYDPTTSDTSSNYSVSSGDSLAFDTNKLRLTRVTDGECYFHYNPNDIENYKGKSLKFEGDINGITSTNLRIYQMVNGSFTNVGGNSVTTGTASVTANIDANATVVLFRVNGNNLGTNGTLTATNLKIYQI